MMTIFDFCDRIQRNLLPSTRYFIKTDGTLYSRIAKLMNEDVYRLMKTMLLLKQGTTPVVHLVYQKQEAEKLKHKEQEKKIAVRQKIITKKSSKASKMST